MAYTIWKQVLNVGFKTPMCGAILASTIGGIILTDSCFKHKHYYFLCEFEPPSGSSRPVTKGVQVKLQNIPRDNTTLQVRSVACPGQHRTHTFLACDSQAECWLSKTDDVQFSPHEVIVSVLSLCHSPRNVWPEPAHFACTSKTGHVPFTLVCDFRADCFDKSDEDFCVHPPSDDQHPVPCVDNQCYKMSRVDNDFGADFRNGVDDKHYVHLESLFEDVVQKPPMMINYVNKKNIPTFVNLDTYQPGSQCPSTHFECPDIAYRMPVFVRCNGVFDCPHHQDEEGCDTYQCPGFYRCRGSKVCLHPLHVCDGVKNCPQYDDEWFCAMTCPQVCSCAGLSFTCPHMFQPEEYPAVRYLDAEGSGLSPGHLWNNSMLVYVSLAACRLKQLALPLLPNVKILDVSNNNISSASLDVLKNVSNLNQLLLASNSITSLFESNVLTSTLIFPRMLHIDLSAVTMEHLYTSGFKPFTDLITLNLSSTSIQKMSGEGLSNLNLVALDLTGCSMEEFPSTLLKNLSQLIDVRGDNPKLCCAQILPAGFDTRRCQAPRFIFSSCENLLGSYPQRVVVAIITTATLLGNSAILLRLFWWRKTKDRVTLFVLQLCMSKCLKGVYLCVLSVMDNVFSGSYLWKDKEWMTGVWCQVLAFLFLLSTQVCVFLHFSMTMDRYLAIAWGHTAWTAKRTIFLCVLCWCGGLVQACMAFWWRDFSQTSLCTALPIPGDLRGGHPFASGLLVFLNVFVMLLTGTVQVYIHRQIGSNPLAFLTDNHFARDLASARRVVNVVITDSVCWISVALLAALMSHGVFKPGDVMYAVSMYIIFVSSSLTPYLYLLSGVLERRSLARKQRLLKRLGYHSFGKVGRQQIL